MAYHAIVKGHVFSTEGEEFPDHPFEPDHPFDFYEHIDELLEFLKQAFLAFRFLLSALTRVAPTLLQFPLL